MKRRNRRSRGEGPSLIEAKTYRFLGHSRGDPPWGPYRTKEEVDSWKKRDPRLVLIKQAGLTPEETERIDKEVEAAIAEAIRFADESPQPDIKIAFEHVYV
jgi:TPP-dependent pyruvate/acetoin dehydrogenase alpha subunit